MSEEFDGTYEVEDGYAGGHRPQHFTVSADDLPDDASDDELQQVYYQAASDDFEQRISFCVDSAEDFIAWAREQLNARKEHGNP